MNFLKKLAPFIATAASLGGPLGALAGSALTAALGAKAGSKVSDVLASLTTAPMTPEQVTALKQAEESFQLQMQAMDIKSLEDLEKMADDDRADARHREIEVKDSTPHVGFYLITCGFFGILILDIFRPEASAIVNTMTGVLGTAWVQVVSYYFGSSRGSDDKTKIIGKIAMQP